MQEHITATYSGRKQAAIAAAFATTRASYPLLVEGATQVHIDQTAFHLLNCLAQGNIRQLLGRLPSRKVFALENARHIDLQTIPVSGTLINLSSWSSQFAIRSPIPRGLILLVNIAHAHRHSHVTCELYIHLDWHASVGNTGRRSITDTVPAYVGDAAAVDLCQQGVVQRNAMLGRREAKKSLAWGPMPGTSSWRQKQSAVLHEN